MPMRMEGDLVDAAKAVGAVSSRSATQQLNRDIRRVLAGEAAYDDLGERGQAVVRAIWDEEMTKRLTRLDLAAEFTREGRSWTEADEQGNAVVRGKNAGA